MNREPFSNICAYACLKIDNLLNTKRNPSHNVYGGGLKSHPTFGKSITPALKESLGADGPEESCYLISSTAESLCCGTLPVSWDVMRIKPVF
jgi:hypothetical protein